MMAPSGWPRPVIRGTGGEGSVLLVLGLLGEEALQLGAEFVGGGQRLVVLGQQIALPAPDERVVLLLQRRDQAPGLLVLGDLLVDLAADQLCGLAQLPGRQ